MSDSYFKRLFVGQTVAADGQNGAYGRASRTFEELTSNVHGKYYEQNKRGNIFMAQAIVSAMVIWTTEAGTGGPLLWNGTTTHDAVILAVGWGETTETTVEGSIGLTGGYGQSAAPTGGTDIDSQGAMDCTINAPLMTVRQEADPGTNRWFIPLGSPTNLAGNTTRIAHNAFIHLDGMIVVKPQGFVSLAASATLTGSLLDAFIIWEEVPV